MVLSQHVVKEAEPMILYDFVIETRGLSKSYKKVNAIRNLDLKVPKNSVFAFLGPNGAGKSTTIKLLLGLISPSSGSGKVFGLDIESQNLPIRTKIGYLPQDARFYDHMTPKEVLRYTLNFYVNGTKEEVDRRIEELLHLVDLESKADRPIKGFSGGERQRLGIAQAMINGPELLILDEPAASLDPIGRRDVLQIIEKLKETTTVIYCTHILADVQKVSDQVAIMNKGELITQGSIQEILNRGSTQSFEITLKVGVGDLRYLNEIEWIDSIAITEKEYTHLDISVSDLEIAEQRLLPEILSIAGVTVIEYKRKTLDLEDVFLELIGDLNGN